MNLWEKTLRFSNAVTVGSVSSLFFSFIFSVVYHGVVYGATIHHKVLCVGDSITAAYSDISVPSRGGFREPLFDMMVNDGFDVEFVGQVVYPNPTSYPITIDESWVRSEGHSGYKAGQVDSEINSWLTTDNPDTVLLHIGTNDVYFSDGTWEPQQTADDVMSIVNKIFTFDPSIDVILAQIINQGNQSPYTSNDNIALTTDLNDLLLTDASANSQYLTHLFVVDQEAALTYPDDLLEQYDTDNKLYVLHPTPTGYDKMADTWYSGVKEAWVPIPGTVWLLGSGLIGILGIRRKFKK